MSKICDTLSNKSFVFNTNYMSIIIFYFSNSIVYSFYANISLPRFLTTVLSEILEDFLWIKT